MAAVLRLNNGTWPAFGTYPGWTAVSSATAVSRRLPQPSPFSLLVWATILLLEAMLIVTYVTVNNVTLSLFHVYPFIWLNVSAWVLWRVSSPSSSRRQKLVAGTVASAYFAVLGYFGGVYQIVALSSHPEHHTAHFEQMGGFDLALSVPPGYGPALFYVGPEIQLTLVPYLVVGYLTLSYLVYVTVLDAANAAASGVLGLFACIGCSWPILAAIFGGGTGAIATAVYSQAYELSTIAFLATVALLYWRPFD